MAVVLVLGLSPITKASATSQSSVSTGQSIEQQVADSAGGDGGAATGTGSEGSGVETVSTAQGSGTAASGADTGEGTKAAVGDGSGSTGSDTGTDTGSAKDDSAGSTSNGTSTDSSDPAPQSSDEGIALASVGGDTTGSYNPGADFVDISNNCGASVELFSDSNCSTPLGDTAKSGDESFYGKLTVTFNDGFRPTLSNPNLSYVFPANAKVSDLAETTLYDNGVAAGTWYISNGVAYFKYSESYLSQTVVNANIKFEAKLNGVDKGDGNSEQLNFPGTSSAVTVNTKDGSVYGSKFGGNMNEQWNGPTYNQDDGTYTWTVKVTPTAHATNVVLTDTIGSNLTFKADSFQLVDAQGNPVTGTCGVVLNGQTANISLGNLSAGDYYVQYKTTVNSLPTTDNTAISNVGNSVKWSWGAEGKRTELDTSRSPQEAKYSMASKYADGSSTPDRIKWVVTLNSGSIKADMGGYTFTDTIDTDQTFLSDGVTITDQSGAAITPEVSETDSSLSFTFPSDAGKKQYTVTYYTKMSDTSSKDAVSNTATVTPPDTSTEPKGTAAGTYNPPDTGKYITKTLVSTVSSDSYDGKASWKSEILFGDMAESTTPTSIEFTDKFGELPSGVQVSLNGDVTVSASDGTPLVAGTDYAIEKATSAQGTWGQLIKITFKDTNAVKSLIGKSGAKVTVSYGTITNQVNGEYPTGTYKNVSSVKTNKKNEISADASYTIEREATPPAVLKNGTSSSWDADYDWGDGTKGAWITDWKVAVNRTGEWEYQYKPVLDLKGADVVVADVLPTEGYSIIKGDVTYKLREGAYGDPVASGTVTPSYTQSDAVITVPTKKADGTSYGKVYVELSYQTATKGTVAGASGTDGAVNKEVSNAASATSGSYNFPLGSGTVQLNNKALSKTSAEISGSSARQYTIVVNENGYDLAADSDTITLVDDMDSRGTFAASTLSVMAGDGVNLLTDGHASYTLSNVPGTDGTVHTRLTLTIPDNTKVTVKYEVMPSGKEGDQLANFSNTCSLSALADSTVTDEQTFTIASNSGGTSSESWGISITKSDSSGKKNLSGAEFELWQVDMDESTKGDIVSSKVGTATSDASGKVTFGTEDAKLASNTLYYFKEVKAPAGYEISFTGDTYVMLKSDATKTDYQAAYDKAVALGCIPSNAVSYSAYDELSKGSFDLGIEKKVEGAEAPADAQFTFKAEATGDNAASAPKLSDVTVTSTAKGAGTYTGTFTGTLSDSMLGQTFTYNVSETAGTAGGWTYDSGAYTATVQVVEQDGKLVGNVSYAKGAAAADAMTFTNTYKTSGTPVLHVKKTVNGGKADSTFRDKNFTFGVYNADSEGHRTGYALQQVKCTPSDNYAYFNWDAKYTESGMHSYVIHEEGTPEAGWAFADDVLVTVTATDNGQGSLVLSYEYSTATEDGTKALFDNTYTEATSATLQAQKILTGRNMNADEFSFQLIYQNEGERKGQVVDTKTAPVSRDGEAATVAFDSLRFTSAGTYNYDIKEAAGSLAHVTYDSSTYRAQVVVTKNDATGKLSAQVKYLKGAEELAADALPTFNNTYTAPATGEFQLKAKKTVNDAAPKAGETFEFSAKYESGYEGAKKIDGLIENAKTDASGMATFGTVTLGEEFYGQSFVLRIHEEGMLSKEWTKAVDVFATVSVSQPTGTEKPVVTVKYNNEETQYASFNNTYSTSTSATLSLSKAVTGGTDAVKDKEFTFALYKKGSDEPLQTVVAKAGQTVSFANALEFTQAGVYEYDIKELGTNGDGWTYAEPTTATVTVTENNDRSLSAEVSYGRAVLDGSAALFTNAYQASGNVPLSVYKTVNGGTDVMKDEEFSFDLYKSNVDGVELDKLATVTAKTGQKASFESRQIAAEGTYYYLISEVGHNDNGWKADSDVLAKVVAADKDGKGTLSFDITYSSVDGAKSRATADGSSAAFDNTYATNVQLKLKKTVNGGALLKGESFDFTLSSVDASIEDTEVATATVDANAKDGTVSLANLTFSAPGTYNYRLSEDASTAEGWTNDDDIDFTITVDYSADGHSLVATLNDSTGRITQGDDGAYTATFNNSYYSETTATLKAHKTIEGATDVAAGKEFKFELRDQSGQLIDTETAKGGQTVSFDELSYSKLMCGTYTYTISESAADGSTAGWAFQDAVTATVVVGMDSTNRQVEVKSITYSMLGNTEYAPYVEADGTQAALFTNKYASTGSADISVQKTVNGGTEAAEGESFTFELYQAKKDEATGEWVKDGEAIDFASVKAGDTATFPDKDGKLHYTAADDGKTFTYIVHETGHNEGGWFAASDVLATVKVSDNGDGTMKAEVAYSNGTNAAAFDNVKSTVTGKIELYKTVNGGPAKPEESFTFQLQPQDGAPAAEQTDITVNGGGKADFGNIEFTEPGEYRYLIHETSELGDGWTNDADVEVVVKVVRDEDGKALKIESIDYGSRAYEADGEVMAHFDNKYVAPGTPKEEGAQPKTTETVSASAQATSTTKTGDSLMLFGGAALALVAVAAGIAAMASRRRKN